MTSIGALLFYAFTLYVAAGILIGAAFVLFGAARVLDHPATISAGGRALLFPASAALWPLVLRRWMKASVRR
jgi:hypothetical protein